jgi:hypothetical protein
LKNPWWLAISFGRKAMTSSIVTHLIFQLLKFVQGYCCYYFFSCITMQYSRYCCGTTQQIFLFRVQTQVQCHRLCTIDLVELKRWFF